MKWVQVERTVWVTSFSRVNYYPNVFEIYRSVDSGYSEFVNEDIVSVESSAYLQPFIANLKPGGLPIGSFYFEDVPVIRC